MPIGNMIPIYLHLRTIDSSTPKPEKIKKFWSLIKSLKKTGLGSHHSEKMEFLGQIQKKKPKFVIGNSNQSFFQAFIWWCHV